MSRKISEKMKQAAAKATVEVAIQLTQIPSQGCAFFAGEPKSKMELKSSDYKKLKSFIKNN